MCIPNSLINCHYISCDHVLSKRGIKFSFIFVNDDKGENISLAKIHILTAVHNQLLRVDCEELEKEGCGEGTHEDGPTSLQRVHKGCLQHTFIFKRLLIVCVGGYVCVCGCMCVVKSIRSVVQCVHINFKI